jgi:hypothetical protein
MVKRGTVVGDLIAVRDTDDAADIESRDWTLSLLVDDNWRPKDGKPGRDSKVPGPPGKDSTVPGPPGKDSTVPGPKGNSIVGPPGIMWRNNYRNRVDYVPGDAVFFEGSSFVCLEPVRSREPSEEGNRYWGLLAKAGRDARNPDTIIYSQRVGGARLGALEEQVGSLLEGAELPSAVAAESIQKKQPIYLTDSGEAAVSNPTVNRMAVGIAVDTVAAGQSVRYVPQGAVSFADWSLARGETYFLGDGEITLTPPTSDGTFSTIVGVALTEQTLSVSILRTVMY